MAGMVYRGIADTLAEARAHLSRVDPAQAAAAQARGALIVDTRPASQRSSTGEIPGSLVIERNVLEWRLDPTSAARIPESSYDAQVVVVCQEGYASSLAAASLQRLGLHRATDLDGGFLAWCAAGLPVAPFGSQRAALVAGATDNEPAH